MFHVLLGLSKCYHYENPKTEAFKGHRIIDLAGTSVRLIGCGLYVFRHINFFRWDIYDFSNLYC